MKESPFLDNSDAVRDLLKQLLLFQDLEERHLHVVAKMVKLRQYDPEEIVISEGGYDESIFILLSGVVRIFKQKALLAELRERGDVFGEQGIINCEARSATVRAIGVTTCLVIDTSFLDRLPEAEREALYTPLYRSLAMIVAGRLRATSDQLALLKDELAMAKLELMFHRR